MPSVIVVCAVISAAAVLAAFLLAARQNDGDVLIISNPTDVEIAVEVRGEVANPGVYRLPEGARLVDLLSAAGNATSEADLASHNLARRLVDAEVVVILPKALASPVAQTTATVDSGANALAYRININSATQSELEALPGIGPVIAQRIVEYRTANGPYQTVSDLAKVDGISETLIAEIENLITTGP